MNCLTGETDSLISNEVHLSTVPSATAVRNQQHQTGTSILGTVFLIVNATLGAGVLNFPQAFDNAGGIATSIITQLGFLFFITATLIILASCSDITNTHSMQDTCAGLCGRKFLYICGIFVAVYSFGCCLTFLIIIGDQFDRVFATFYGMDFCNHWLDVLSYASSVGCVTILYVVWLIIYESFAHEDSASKPVKIWPDNSLEALEIVPIICFAYQSHMTAIPTYACMKNRKIGQFTLCAIISMTVCFVVYCVVGIFGYITFGIGKVPSDILQGYMDKNISLAIAIVAIAVKNFTTYPIVLYCGRDAVLGLFGLDIDMHIRSRIMITLIWFVATLSIAIYVPDIAPVINLLGALSATFIFILPGICLLQSTLLKDPELYLNKDRLLLILAIVITTIGAFVFGVVLMEAVQDLQKDLFKNLKVAGFKAMLGQSLCK
ncbi:sodium-coupled neutral amino acid transporter 7-like isoform X2 [Prorops nasuta]|uniref:sodium-coupled neutral amino acid transporter 7-like isoform X2 n=1 Tax=Prorops nasuta TaxID=863751 RepID=UPI0034CE0404